MSDETKQLACAYQKFDILYLRKVKAVNKQTNQQTKTKQRKKMHLSIIKIPRLNVPVWIWFDVVVIVIHFILDELFSLLF